MFIKHLVSLSIFFALSGCNPAPTEAEPSAQQTAANVLAIHGGDANSPNNGIVQAVTAFAKQFIAAQPAMATSLNLSKTLAGEFASKLPDYSSQGMQAFQKQMQQAATELKAMELTGLSYEDKRHLLINGVIGQYYAGDTAFSGGYIDTWAGHLPYIVNQISGPLIDIPAILTDQQVVASLDDAKDYLKRLSALAVMASQVKAKVEEDASNGIILPKALFPNTLKYLANFVEDSADKHSLVTSFADKLALIETLDDTQKQALVAQATSLVDAKIYPVYQAIAQYMIALEEKAPVDVGIWAQPKGEAFYQHAIKFLGDSELSADAIHQLGLDEVTRITNEMDSILKANGYSQGTVGERMLALNTEARFLYDNSDAGREQLLTDLSSEINKVMTIAPKLFATLPTQEVVVKRVPVETQAGAAGGSYVPPALDGSRAGVFFINLMDMSSITKYGLKTLTYHEAVPGHHFQIALGMLQTDIGLMRQNASFNAFIEGWALYAEQTAFEMGMYKDDPWGNLGRLKAEAYRAARLVVDTGLHHKKWRRQQAIEYFATATGSTQANVVSAIDRYIAWPGQALGYKLGMLKFIELRQQAKAALGDKFDIRSFHDVILLPGARPMSVVAADIEQWINQELK